jgi:hypothetical protein
MTAKEDPMTPGQRRVWRRVQLGLIIAVAAILVYVTFFHVNDHELRLTGTADATIVSDELSHRAMIYHYRYVVAGRVYQGEELSSNFAFGVGISAKACYDPGEPSRSILKPMGATCGSGG